jgi:exodeoxyribonuclease VII large subunit
MPEKNQVFTLKQVVSSIRKTIEGRYAGFYWVKAEMHKLNLFPSGHAFPELVQKENDRIVAQINGAIWSHNLEKINKKFVEIVKEPIKEGSTLLMQVKISYSELYGLNLQILDIDPSYALGELQKERENTLKKLYQENLLNRNQLLSFPLLPKRIAVISAETSKGLSDFLNILNNNSWNYKVFTMVFNAYLQGDLAVQSIIEQLGEIRKVQHHFDVVVIVRGGGGEVGMTCYNNYELCKAIANFELPILTGIGHSTNLTVAEMVAFKNAITPTELADFILQCFHNFIFPVQQSIPFIKNYSIQLLQMERKNFDQEVKQFKNNVSQLRNSENFKLKGMSQIIRSESKSTIHLQIERIRKFSHFLNLHSKTSINNQNTETFQIERTLKKLVLSFIQERASKVQQIEKTINLLDPIHVLKRGYSITLYNGETIKKNLQLKSGSCIETITENCIITSTITNLKNNDGEN